MGVDTHAKLKGEVLPEVILNFIKQTIDADAKMNIETRKQKGSPTWMHTKSNCKDWYETSGFMHFATKDGNKRMMFYSYSNVNSLENLEYYAKCGLKDMAESETTFLSLGYNEEAVEIMKSVVTEFGGWLDESDCDDEEYYPITKDENGNIKPVIYVTMDEIYEKFGGTVIIKSK